MITVVQKTAASFDGVSSAALTLTGVSASNSLVVILGSSAPPSSTPTGYTSLYVPSPTGVNDAVNVFYINQSPSAGSNTCTVALPGNSFCSLALLEVSGLLASPLDATNVSNPGALQTASVSTGTLAQATEIVFASLIYTAPGGVANAAITDPPSGFTSIFVQNASISHQPGEMAYQIVSATTSVTASWSWTDPAEGNVQAAIISLKGSTGAVAVSDGSVPHRSLRLGTPFSRLRGIYDDTTFIPPNSFGDDGRAPQRLLRLGTPLSRLRGTYDDTISGGIGVLAASAASASVASLSLASSPGLLSFFGASASAASFALSAGIALSGASVSTAVVPVSSGISIVGASTSTASVGMSAGSGVSGSSASSATFDMSASTGVLTFEGTSVSSASFATSISIGLNGSSASAAIFSLLGTGALPFIGASTSSAVVDTSGSIGSLTFNGVSASVAFVDVEPLSAGSIFFSGASSSVASFTITGPFTPPIIVTPTGALLPGVPPKTAIEADRGFKHPWQATGAPIVPSPFMGSSETIQPAVSVIQTVRITRQETGSEDGGSIPSADGITETELLMIMLGSIL